MSNTELNRKLRELKELKIMQDELQNDYWKLLQTIPAMATK